jgi:hypothetical protein
MKDNDHEEQDIKYLEQRYQQKRIWPKEPSHGSKLISQLMARKGYGQTQVADHVEQQWQTAVGLSLGQSSRTGNFRRGILEVIVKNSSVMQELMFQKRNIIQRLNAESDRQQISDVKFKIGPIY